MLLGFCFEQSAIFPIPPAWGSIDKDKTKASSLAGDY